MLTARDSDWWLELPTRIKWLMRGEWWTTRFGRWVCERDRHSPGVVWHNVGGDEPDMHCRRCGKWIG